MITREKYIAKIRPFYESDLIKIITGIRRCGKSVVLEQVKSELESQGKKIIYLNFEKRAVYDNLYNDKTLLDYIQQKINESPNEKWYVFLDEIQTVENWNLACKSLRLENISLFITGSNSKLLSREFTKELSGRYVSFLIKPFVYKEIAEYAKELNKEISINNYLIYGGFPKRIEFNDEEAMIQYLNDLDQTIVINDIINRYKIRKDNIFKKVANFVLISNSRIFSGNSIFNYLKSQKIECSINTVMKFLDYLEEILQMFSMQLATVISYSFYCLF